MAHLSYTGLIALSLVLAAIGRVIYNVYFHPLAAFPGPFWYRASRVPFAYSYFRGHMTTTTMLRLHERYGDVVRVAPDELAFSSPQAWRDIYGHRSAADGGELPKSVLFYRIPAQPPSLLNETAENHAALRRLVAGGFSDRSMREQEPIIGSYVDLLIRRLREHCVDRDAKDERTGLQKRRRLDMASWYNWTTFDVIGDLAFGEPFGCLDRAEYHPWVAAVQNAIRATVVFLMAKYFHVLPLILPIAKVFMTGRQEHLRRTKEKMQRRVDMKTGRHDLIAPLVAVKDELGFDRLRINAGLFIIAGSETTATLLSGITFLLLSNPDTLRRVTDEVRSSFGSDADITLLSVNNLTYMLACLNEALRLYPPAAGPLPRSTENGATTIDGVLVPKNTYVAVWQWATYHRSAYFRDPLAFRPERWLGDPAYASDSLDVVRPFSLGPRDCVGKNLAYAEMRLILARVLFNFDMELADKDVNWLDQRAFVLWDKPPLDVYLTPR